MKNSILIIFILSVLSCVPEEPDGPIVDKIPEFAFAGGETTIFDVTSLAYATPAPNLSQENFNRHLDGDLAFEQTFVTEPADVNPGLGPVFNNNSCVSCHIRNGRSRPSDNGSEISGFLLRISIPGDGLNGAAKPVPHFGTQLQTRSIYQSKPEASFTTNEITEIVEFIDNSTQEISRKEYTIQNPYMPFPQEVLISPRVAPAVFGLGLLEAIPDEQILALADPQDLDSDGISGKVNMVWSVETNKFERGIFGWKAEMPSAQMQTADAYHQDMGVTTSLFPEESCVGQDNCEDDGIVDLSDESLDATTFYFQSLAVPAPRNYNDEEFLEGQKLFAELKCNSCHVPSHRTGNAIIPELENQRIYPYTDLLLHDMGEGLADNRPTFAASGKEWRTPPLWGIGLLPVVNGHMNLLHDGRAKGIEEAILWHGGEAKESQLSYISLEKTEREALLMFIRSL